MKAVILAGGLGSRLGEETDVKPKPMVTVGDRPMLWHIMKIYSSHGINDFIVCLGYKGYAIKEYFLNYFLHTSDVTIDLANNGLEIHRNNSEPWRVTLVDTGQDSMTGGRLLRVAPFLTGEEAFCMTYGDGVSDIDITAEIAFHRTHGGLATLASVRPPGRFGALSFSGTEIDHFEEKPDGDNSWINGGYFVLSPKVLNYISDDQTIWEQEPLRRLAAERQLHAFFHHGFWQCMDTLRDKRYLDAMWMEGAAPWKSW